MRQRLIFIQNLIFLMCLFSLLTLVVANPILKSVNAEYSNLSEGIWVMKAGKLSGAALMAQGMSRDLLGQIFLAVGIFLSREHTGMTYVSSTSQRVAVFIKDT
jgi:hypothetical protein